MTRRWVSHPTAWRDIHGLQAWEEPMSARFTEEWLMDYQVRQHGAQPNALPRPALTAEQIGRETPFMWALIKAAEAQGYRYFHVHNSRKSVPGYPDLTLAKAGRPLLLLETKTNTGVTSDEQTDWIDLLRCTERPLPAVVRPALWQEVLTLLGYGE